MEKLQSVLIELVLPSRGLARLGAGRDERCLLYGGYH